MSTNLTPAQRAELARLQERLQATQLQRVLMPGAPPRKRASKYSPPREECEILPTIYVGKKRRTAAPPPSRPQEEVHDDQEAGVSTAAAASWPSLSAVEPWATDLNEFEFDDTDDEWVPATDDLSDSDMDDTDDTDNTDNTDDTDHNDDDERWTLPPAVSRRDAASEPATDADMSAHHAHVLRAEDARDDRALRAFVPTDCHTFHWTNDKHTFTGQRETFTETPGPTFQLTAEMRPTDIFYKMIDTDFIDLLCTETNRYAAQKISRGQLTENSRLHRWTPTDRDEMIAFLSVLILQGLYSLPNEEAYFSFNGFGTMPYFSKIMSYNRFLLLKIMLHFVDNDAGPNPSKLNKIQPVIDYLNKKFKELYYPEQNIVIDESLLKWQGRLGFTQKISSKAAKVGIKTYELCESRTGYLWNFFVYCGKKKQTDQQRQSADGPTTNDEGQEHDGDEQDDDNQTNDQCPSSATANIVKSLVGPLLNRGHTLIMDNFYNSPLLARYLKKNKTDCFGTLRLNREFVPASLKILKVTDLRHCEVVASYCSDLSVVVWRDAKLVSLISTYHTLQIGGVDKDNKLKYKPSVVLEYNKSMGGVDKKDQVLSAQPVDRIRNKVWYKKLFRRLYSTAIFNCYVIYKTTHPKMDHAVFRRVLAEDLLRLHKQIDITKERRILKQTARSSGDVRPANNRPQLTHNHFPARTGSKYTRCWWCANMKKKSTRTSYKCPECEVNLCVDDCFKQYHII